MAKRRTAAEKRIGGDSDDLDFMTIRNKSGKVVLDTAKGIVPKQKRKQRAVRIRRQKKS